MSMLQYRHKSRAWRQMVTADDEGTLPRDQGHIAQGIAEGEEGEPDREADLAALLERLRQIRGRLAPRIAGMPDDATLREHLEQLNSATLHTLLVSGPWDTGGRGRRGGRLDLLLPAPEAAPAPAFAAALAAA